jgi:hypothetical protein
MSSAYAAPVEGIETMFCIACGAPVTSGISYCNRCGVSLKERDEPTTPASTPFVAAIATTALVGMGIMLGGIVTLRAGAAMPIDFIGIFMILTFIIILFTEILLVRQLSKLTKSNTSKLSRHENRGLPAAQQYIQPEQIPFAPARALAEPVASVTENTTRTLDYARTESGNFQSK